MVNTYRLSDADVTLNKIIDLPFFILCVVICIYTSDVSQVGECCVLYTLLPETHSLHGTGT